MSKKFDKKNMAILILGDVLAIIGVIGMVTNAIYFSFNYFFHGRNDMLPYWWVFVPPLIAGALILEWFNRKIKIKVKM